MPGHHISQLGESDQQSESFGIFLFDETLPIRKLKTEDKLLGFRQGWVSRFRLDRLG